MSLFRFAQLFPVAMAMVFTSAISLADDRPRLAILTDIGGDPDDRQSLIRLMVYANEFRLEALIASASGTPGELKESVTRPDIIRDIVHTYGKVRPNLMRHAQNWPEESTLLGVIKSGNPYRQREHIGKPHDTEASRFLIERIDAGSAADPLNIAIWGGQTDLAQALWRIKHDRGERGLADFVKKFRVHDIDDQDRIADWMRQEFPGMHYILSKAPKGTNRITGTFRGMFLTGDESLTSREWVEKHLLHTGPLGAMYPTKTHTWSNPHNCLKEGDTPSWLFFLPLGGNDPADPAKPGWGGQYQRESDGWYVDIPFVKEQQQIPHHTISRWRPDFQADFAKRMSWCRDQDR